MVDGLKKGDRALDSTGRKANKLGTTFDSLKTKTGALRAAFAALAAVGIARFFTAAINAAAKFETSMAEISTLVDTATFSLDRLTDAIESASIAFGSDATVQAAAAYQIVSAGATSAAEATDILTASNKLAVGGVTDVATAADGLTSLLNAYGLAASEATNVSDALFIGVKAGKTTINELASSIGKVAPLAAQSGVSIDELVSGIAALTKGGISTTEAVTGIRAVMAAVVKPTSEATKLAEKLGINFSAAGLKAQGFGAFMEEVKMKTGGSTAAMAQLFGGVEALVPVLALSGQAGIDFANTMEAMGEKAGATDEAFEKLSNTFAFQAARVRQGLMSALRDLGGLITSVLTPALRLLADNFETIITFTKTFATLVGVALLPKLVALIPVLTALTVRLALMAAAWLLTPFGQIAAAIMAVSAALTFLGTRTIEIGGITATVWQAIWAAIKTVIDIFVIVKDATVAALTSMWQASSEFFSGFTKWLPDLSGAFSDAWDFIVGITKQMINTNIGLFVGLVKSIGPIITQGIPALFNQAYGAVVNATIAVVEFIVNKFASALGAIGSGLDLLPGIEGLGEKIKGALTIDLSDSKANMDELKAATMAAGTAIKDTFSEAVNTDYVGAFGNAVKNVAAPAVQIFKDNLNELVDTSNDTIDVATQLTDPVLPSLGTSMQELGNEAGGAAAKTKALNDELERPVTIQDGIKDAWSNISNSIKTEGEIVSSALTQLFDGVGDAIVEFAKTGKLNFRELAASVAASVLKMTTKLLLFKALSSFGIPGLGLKDGGMVPGFASGGMVSGPGGPRSDKVPAMLSNGEFVVNAAATKRFGGLLQQINSGQLQGLQQLASGGLAAANDNTSLSAPMAPASDGRGQSDNAPAQVNVISTIADKDIAAAINTPEGEQVIINMLQRKKNVVQGIVNG